MRLLTLLFLFFIVIPPLCASPSVRSSLRGRITDTSGAPLPGAIVELPDLHTGAASDAEGRYVLTDLPSGRFLVSVKLLGFATRSGIVQLEGETSWDFTLVPAVLEQHGVVVTGTSAATEQRRSTAPIQSLSARQLRENVSTNVIDAITRVPGVQQISTGPAISKPVIRGLGFNRIITLSDGIRQEGQQWGSEHGIEIDDYNVSRVEVLKGPASLAYGSDAIAGVINILSEAPAPLDRITGNLVAGYQTNNGLGSLHARLAGNSKGRYWSAWYTGKAAHDYRNPHDGHVYNTRFRNSNYGASIGVNRHWGSSRLSFSSFNQHLGIAEGARDSATGRFIRPVNEGGMESMAIADDGRSYEDALPRQQINHQKLTWVNTVYMRNGARAGLSLGLQQNDRREFDDVLMPEEPGLFLRLRTLNYGLQYLVTRHGGWQLSGGINGMLQRSDNKGVEFLIPDYSLFDIGAYFTARKDFGRWTLEGGLRADHRSLSAESLFLDSLDSRVTEPAAGGYTRFAAFRRGFASPSGSLGASYMMSDRLALKANAAAGYRAPNIAELASNGVHEGAIRYEYGHTGLRPEHSFQIDAGIQYTSEHLSVQASLFYNYIRNFIYTRRLTGLDGADSVPAFNNEEGFPAFIHDQTEALLTGGELFLDFHPHPFDWLHMEHTLSYVHGRNLSGTDSTRYLPNIPGPRWLVGLSAQPAGSFGMFSRAYIKIELDHYFPQDLIYSAYGTETPSVSYSLVNASIGFDLMRKKQTLMSVTIAGQNLGDVAYQHHLSRLRYAAQNSVTGRTGIFGMGRNISLSVAVPLNFR